MDFFHSSLLTEVSIILFTLFVALIFPMIRYGSKITCFVKTGKKMGPTDWGHYEGVAAKEDPAYVRIATCKPTREEIRLSGSRAQ